MRSPETAPRLLAPDLVRGAALLGVALATVPAWLYARPTGPGGRPVGGPVTDRVVDAAGIVLVDARVFPAFALLLGWGTARALRRGPSGGGWRRVGVLLGLGAVVAVLLDGRNVLGLYAVSAAVVILLARARAAVVGVAAVLVAGPGLLTAGLGRGTGGAEATIPGPAAWYPLSAAERLAEWVVGVTLAPLVAGAFVAAALAGALVARTTWLDRPDGHRRLLAVAGLTGLALGVAGGVPLAAAAWQADSGLPDLSGAAPGVLHAVTGLAGGAGAVAALAWVASWRRVPDGRGRRPSPPGRAAALLSAAGRLPLTCYVAQLAVFAAVLAPWAGGVGAWIGSAGAAALAVAVWMVTSLGASAWVRSGLGRGPLERLLRGHRGRDRDLAPDSMIEPSGGSSNRG
ncbi:MAG: DUF418 domain-containing protein [Kineosporiaceae bacterium]